MDIIALEELATYILWVKEAIACNVILIWSSVRSLNCTPNYVPTHKLQGKAQVTSQPPVAISKPHTNYKIWHSSLDPT